MLTSPATLTLTPLGGGCPRRLAACPLDQDLTAFCELRKTGGPHAVRQLKPAGDYSLILVLLLDRDRAHRDGVVRLDPIDERAVRTVLHRGCWDHHDPPDYIDQHPTIHQLAPPYLKTPLRDLPLTIP